MENFTPISPAISNVCFIFNPQAYSYQSPGSLSLPCTYSAPDCYCKRVLLQRHQHRAGKTQGLQALPAPQRAQHMFRQLASPTWEGGTNGKSADWWYRCNQGGRVRANTAFWRMEWDQGRERIVNKGSAARQARATYRKQRKRRFISHLCGSKVVKPHGGFTGIFSLWLFCERPKITKQLNLCEKSAALLHAFGL